MMQELTYFEKFYENKFNDSHGNTAIQAEFKHHNTTAKLLEGPELAGYIRAFFDEKFQRIRKEYQTELYTDFNECTRQYVEMSMAFYEVLMKLIPTTELQEEATRKLFFTFEKVPTNLNAFRSFRAIIPDPGGMVTQYFTGTTNKIHVMSAEVFGNYLNSNKTFWDHYFSVQKEDDSITNYSDQLLGRTYLEVLSTLILGNLVSYNGPGKTTGIISQVYILEPADEFGNSYNVKFSNPPTERGTLEDFPDNDETFVILCTDSPDGRDFCPRNGVPAIKYTRIQQFWKENPTRSLIWESFNQLKRRDVFASIQKAEFVIIEDVKSRDENGKEVYEKKKTQFPLSNALDFAKFFRKCYGKTGFDVFVATLGEFLPEITTPHEGFTPDQTKVCDLLRNQLMEFKIQSKVFRCEYDYEFKKIIGDGWCAWNALVQIIYGDTDITTLERLRKRILSCYIKMRKQSEQFFMHDDYLSSSEGSNEWKFISTKNKSTAPVLELTYEDHTTYLSECIKPTKLTETMIRKHKIEPQPYAMSFDIVNFLAALGLKTIPATKGPYRNKMFDALPQVAEIERDNIVSVFSDEEPTEDAAFFIPQKSNHYDLFINTDKGIVEKARNRIKTAFETMCKKFGIGTSGSFVESSLVV